MTPVVRAYRSLYRQGLKAIRYSTPARHVLRSTLRSSFRSSPREEFDQSRIDNTLAFMQRAAEFKGLEHRILRNLLMTRYWETPGINKDSRILKALGLSKEEHRIRKDASEYFNLTLDRLNDSLGTCLK